MAGERITFTTYTPSHVHERTLSAHSVSIVALNGITAAFLMRLQEDRSIKPFRDRHAFRINVCHGFRLASHLASSIPQISAVSAISDPLAAPQSRATLLVRNLTNRFSILFLRVAALSREKLYL